MITAKMLQSQVSHLQSQGYDVDLEWTYGRPRVTNKEQSVNISPRLPTGQLDLWLSGFKAGIEAKQCLVKK